MARGRGAMRTATGPCGGGKPLLYLPGLMYLGLAEAPCAPPPGLAEAVGRALYLLYLLWPD